jgi:uncharacterized repeat protein (TIGR03809 family)
MPEAIPSAFRVEVSRKWRGLAQRRKEHLVDLYNSGRWRLYYSEAEFLQRVREAARMVDLWSATEQASSEPEPAVSANADDMIRSADLPSARSEPV